MCNAGNVVFFGNDSDGLEAVDGKTGQPLWQFRMGQRIHASPMSYAVDGKEYVAIAAGSDVFVFGL
jgi:alcohol dehydrogenase (cytochrome c)